jgi:hypothetical protein
MKAIVQPVLASRFLLDSVSWSPGLASLLMRLRWDWFCLCALISSRKSLLAGNTYVIICGAILSLVRRGFWHLRIRCLGRVIDTSMTSGIGQKLDFCTFFHGLLYFHIICCLYLNWDVDGNVLWAMSRYGFKLMDSGIFDSASFIIAWRTLKPLETF